MGEHEHHDGLAFHLRALREGTLKRREVMGWAVGAGLGTLVGCGDDSSASRDGGTAANGGKGGKGGSAASSGTGGKAGTAAAGHSGSGGSTASGGCTNVPTETAGPYPADGTNSAGGLGMGGPGGPGTGSSGGALINALTMSGIVRKNIRTSFDSSTTTAPGVPITIKLQIVASNDSCKPLAGAAVYVWHCDRGGNYSLYSSSVTSENYLRGVQEADDDGNVEFESIFPACYSGRWPHIHYEVFPTLAKATIQSNSLGISQIALPEDTCNVVFKESGYEASVNNFKNVSLTTDMVFQDGYDLELPSVSGSVGDGYVVSLATAVTKK